MKLCIFLSLLLSFSYACKAQKSPLSSYQWKNRLVIFCISGDSGQKLMEEQKTLLSFSGQEFEERDLLAFVVKNDKIFLLPNRKEQAISSRAVEAFLSVEEGNHFQVSLIGLDGGIKLQQNQPIRSEKLYSTIDAMPMRQREMENNKD